MASESNQPLTTMRTSADRRIVLEIRSWKFGYVVIEGHDLLEWGVCRFPSGGSTVAVRKFIRLVTMYPPSLVITRRTRRAKHRSVQGAKHLLQRLRQALKVRSIPLVVLSRTQVRSFFFRQGYTNKHSVGQAVAEHFERLKQRIPKARKPWDPERHIAVVFDAAATAIAFEELQQ